MHDEVELFGLPARWRDEISTRRWATSPRAPRQTRKVNHRRSREDEGTLACIFMQEALLRQMLEIVVIADKFEGLGGPHLRIAAGRIEREAQTAYLASKATALFRPRQADADIGLASPPSIHVLSPESTIAAMAFVQLRPRLIGRQELARKGRRRAALTESCALSRGGRLIESEYSFVKEAESSFSQGQSKFRLAPPVRHHCDA